MHTSCQEKLKPLLREMYRALVFYRDGWHGVQADEDLLSDQGLSAMKAVAAAELILGLAYFQDSIGGCDVCGSKDC